jgi:hypothetical protein
MFHSSRQKLYKKPLPVEETFPDLGDTTKMKNFSDFYNERLLLEFNDVTVKKLIEKFKTEQNSLSNENILYYLQRFEQLKNSTKFVELIKDKFPEITIQNDIFQYTFKQLEYGVDQFPKNNTLQQALQQVSPQQNLILLGENEGLKVYYAKNEQGCIEVNSGVFGNTKPYSFCVTRKHNGMYGSYRYGKHESSFYFLYDSTLRVTDIKHLLVIQVTKCKTFILTYANNTYNEEITLEELLKIQPKLAPIINLLTHQKYNAEEAIAKWVANHEYYSSMRTYEEKKMWLEMRPRGLILQDFKTLPDDLKNLWCNVYDDGTFSYININEIFKYIFLHEPALTKRFLQRFYRHEFHKLCFEELEKILPANLKQEVKENYFGKENLEKINTLTDPIELFELLAKLNYATLNYDTVNSKFPKISIIRNNKKLVNKRAAIETDYNKIEKYLPSIIQRNINNIKGKFNIKFNKIYLIPNKPSRYDISPAWLYYILGTTKKGKDVLYYRRQGINPQSTFSKFFINDKMYKLVNLFNKDNFEQMKKITEAFELGDKPDMFHSSRQKLYKKPLPVEETFPDLGNTAQRYIEFITSESYKKAVERMERYLGMQATGENLPQAIQLIFSSYMQVIQFQQGHEKQLAKLALQTVLELEEFKLFKDLCDKGYIIVDAQIDTPNLDNALLQSEKPKDKKQLTKTELANVKAAQLFTSTDENVLKRKFANMISQGNAVNKLYLFQLASDKLNAMHPRLVNLYGITALGAQIAYYAQPNIKLSREMLEMAQVGSEEVTPEKNGPEKNGVYKITARASLFPYLIHEIVKGFYDYLSMDLVPQEELDKETIEDEMVDIMSGPELYSKITQFIPQDKNYLTPLVYKLLINKPIATIKQVLYGGGQAQNIYKALIGEAEAAMKKFNEPEEPTDYNPKY